MNYDTPYKHFIGIELSGRQCALCDKSASHRISEEITKDDPTIFCRPVFVSYVCCDHFRRLMGEGVMCPDKLDYNYSLKQFFYDCLSAMKGDL